MIILSQLPPIAILVNSLLTSAPVLVWLFLLALSLLFFSYTRPAPLFLKKLKVAASLDRLRLYLAYVLFFAAFSVIFWIIDVYVTNIPDPVVPFILYVLLMTVNFGFTVSLLTSIPLMLLVHFDLIEPRYRFYSPETTASFWLDLIGVTAALIIGRRIRSHQLSLLKDTEDLRMLIKARDQFASIAAHDLKNPLTTIKLYAQRLEEKHNDIQSGSRIHDSIATIDRETDKLLAMVDRLLDFSRLQNNKFNLAIEAVDLPKVCLEKIEVMRSLYTGHRFKYHKSGALAKVLADRVALDRILTNLLTNAVKYSPANSKIELSLKKVKSFIQLKVRDQGVGLHKDQLARLFEPFYQTSENNQGLGLGLYITKRLAELQGGKISVRSSPNKGSTFTVWLPAAPAKAVPPRRR